MKSNETYMTDDTITSLFFCTARRLHQKGGGEYAQQKILRILQCRKEIPQKEMQDILKIQPGSLSELTAKLEEKELIARKRSEEDQRRIVLQITQKGEEWISRFRETKDEHMFSALSEKERAQLRGLLEKIAEEDA